MRLQKLGTTKPVHSPRAWSRVKSTGKSLLEALILASTNPQYDKRLFIDLPVQYMKTTSSEQNCFLFLF